jgi:hypothetical protein
MSFVRVHQPPTARVSRRRSSPTTPLRPGRPRGLASAAAARRPTAAAAGRQGSRSGAGRAAGRRVAGPGAGRRAAPAARRPRSPAPQAARDLAGGGRTLAERREHTDRYSARSRTTGSSSRWRALNSSGALPTSSPLMTGRAEPHSSSRTAGPDRRASSWRCSRDANEASLATR